ncbi:alpha/beta fold hydrolase [Bradyrhizobium sp.]|uniref:alpha/beta fold hydrolase n=4 Tax=Nitrobacteraceae TaxID=41294 RepID=UPI003918E19D
MNGAGLTPASGCQDHTTSSPARTPLVHWRLTAIAPRTPRIVTTRTSLFDEAGWREISMTSEKKKYKFRAGPKLTDDTVTSAMTNRIFIHGVPDTPAIWGPLIAALGETVAVPCLPGFCGEVPAGFGGSKDDYADWFVALMEAQHAAFGPLDLVGHDWGALLVLRAASLRPELVRSWAVAGGALDPGYRGHLIARIWNTPVLGEIFMALSSRRAMARMFRQSGLPADLAAYEAAAWRAPMRRSILALYRSADGLRFSGDWIERLAQLPPRGLVISGTQDPYVPLDTLSRFAQRHGAPLHVEQDAGHWSIVERPQSIAAALRAHWAG